MMEVKIASITTTWFELMEHLNKSQKYITH